MIIKDKEENTISFCKSEGMTTQRFKVLYKPAQDPDRRDILIWLRENMPTLGDAVEIFRKGGPAEEAPMIVINLSDSWPFGDNAYAWTKRDETWLVGDQRHLKLALDDKFGHRR
ncbi:hypothetical protein GF373_17570 [bacterium]|nr:hypothetical protein [bacterium]